MQRAWPVVLILLSAVACGEERRGGGGSSPRKGPSKTVESVSLVLERGSLGAGETGRATITAVYAGGTSADLSGSATWSSSDVAIATVAAGTITGVAPGQATITAAVAGKTATAIIVVTPPGTTVVGFAIDPIESVLEVGETHALVAREIFSTGDRIDASARATFTSGAPTIVAMSGAVATAVGPGSATITATLDGRTAMIAIDVRAAVAITSVEVTSPRSSLGPSEAVQLVATAVKSDGSREVVTPIATWRSSNAAVVSVDSSGRATGVASGTATIFASHSGHEGSTSISVVVCQYPAAPTNLGTSGTLPNMSWVGAYDGNGSPMNFSTSAFFCDSTYDRYSSIHFIVGAGWCPNCPEYLANVGAIAGQIEAAGGMVVFVEIEDSSYAPATHSNANQTVSQDVASGVGLRIGDGQTMPSPMVFGNAVSSVPNAFVVRRSDMQVIASQATSQYVLDFVDLAQQAAGGSGPGPGPGPTTRCGPNDEEVYEPNDSSATAGALPFGSPVSGGLCVAQTRDYYRVTSTGSWTLDLSFTHSVGDLDVYVWDDATQAPLEDASGNPVGSEGTVDNESFSWSGAATIVVLGYQGATAPYEILLR
jgi:hypothetical protein